MRLKEPPTQQRFSGDSDPDESEIVDHILGGTERKRSRPTSSLDVKVANGEKLTRPPIPKKKQSQQMQRNTQSSSPYPDGTMPTRAQGGGGIPKHKYDISDLGGMSEEELLQALYDDPELAAAAAAAAEKLKKAERSSRSSKSRYRTADSSNSHTTSPPTSRKAQVDPYPAHLRAMMDDGVPVTQWIFLLLLLGVGLYQLRKALVGPTARSFGAKARKGADKNHAGKKGSKQKGKKDRVKSTRAPIEEIPHLVMEKPAEAASKPAATAAAANKKKNKTRNKHKPSVKVANKKPTAKETVESPDSASTDGSSATDAIGEPEQLSPTSSIGNNVANVTLNTTTVVDDSFSSDDGWTTVGVKSSGGINGSKGNRSSGRGTKPAAQTITTARSKTLPKVVEQVPEASAPETNVMEEEVQEDALTNGENGKKVPHSVDDIDYNPAETHDATLAEDAVIGEEEAEQLAEEVAMIESTAAKIKENGEEETKEEAHAEPDVAMEEPAQDKEIAVEEQSQEGATDQLGAEVSPTDQQDQAPESGIDSQEEPANGDEQDEPQEPSAQPKQDAPQDENSDEIQKENLPPEPEIISPEASSDEKPTSLGDNGKSGHNEASADATGNEEPAKQQNTDNRNDAETQDQGQADQPQNENGKSENGSSADTTEDEALAKRLQLEEEKMAQRRFAKPKEEEWAEVPVKRKRKNGLVS